MGDYAFFMAAALRLQPGEALDQAKDLSRETLRLLVDVVGEEQILDNRAVLLGSQQLGNAGTALGTQSLTACSGGNGVVFLGTDNGNDSVANQGVMLGYQRKIAAVLDHYIYMNT